MIKLLRWGFSLFLQRVCRFGLPETSWRSKCPFQQPPPLILAKGVKEAQWGEERRKEYVRKKLRRKRLGSIVHPLIPILIPAWAWAASGSGCYGRLCDFSLKRGER
jgi:hypothetical protein